MRIVLDIRKTVEQNAATYFERAKKLKAKSKGAREAVARFQTQLAALESKSAKAQAAKPSVTAVKAPKGCAAIEADHPLYGKRWLICDGAPQLLFTENETNAQRLYGVPNRTPYVKDSINDYVVHGAMQAVNPAQTGTKSSAHYPVEIPAGGSVTLQLRFTDQAPSAQMFGKEFDAIFARVKKAGLDFGSHPYNQSNGEINHWNGGRGFYFHDPNGHSLELLTTP